MYFTVPLQALSHFLPHLQSAFSLLCEFDCLCQRPVINQILKSILRFCPPFSIFSWILNLIGYLN